MSNNEQTKYNKIEGINFSLLKEYHKSPMHFKYAIDNPRQSTDAQTLGTLVHSMVLEPHTIDDDFTVMDMSKRPDPTKDFRSQENKLWKQQLIEEAAHHNRALVDVEVYAQAKLMADSVLSNPVIKSLIDRATIERGIMWTDPVTKLKCKGRPDAFIEEKNLIIDLKTTISAHPSDFQKSIWNYRYHEQAAFYSMGLKALYGTDKFDKFLFIAVENKAPYCSATYFLSPNALDVGWVTCQSLLNLHKKCVDSNDWSQGYEVLADHKSGIMDLDLPAYAYKKQEDDELTEKY
jgi:exodeoxyribonuclease VIII